MNKTIAAGLIALATVVSAPASATVITFDTDAQGNAIANGTAITTQYASLGVTFQGVENGSPVNVVAYASPDGYPTPSTPNALTNCSDSGCSNRADILKILFGSGASGISFGFNSFGSNSVTFNLFDAANNLLETQTVTSAMGVYLPVTFVASGVSRIEGLQPTDSWAWGLDNLSFTTASAVPEPGTWFMMLVGFAAIGASLRRRQRLYPAKLA